jgi:hypothetical protein
LNNEEEKLEEDIQKDEVSKIEIENENGNNNDNENKEVEEEVVIE